MFRAWAYRLRHGRDPRQARYLTLGSLRWIVKNRAWTPFFLVRYWRLFVLRLRRPDVVLEGMVFLGKGCTVYAHTGYGRLVIGKFVHLGDMTRLRAHDGTLRIGDHTVFGSDNTVNCFLDIEIGAGTLISDWTYICDFDHVIDDVHSWIMHQGIVKTPVRIGPGTWMGVKSSVLRGTIIGEGSVLAAHAVARGVYPDRAIIAGVPGKVVADRDERYREAAAQRAALADMARKHAAF
ncbi:acyltransferase [Spongisporangium articulatum]|uniref:Acyltransferase n=1 Tax=Spongisporangium articulatum TaxID=3362603 RepID=A0ABW8ANA9_9ACTN